jgi:hypothetical protein
MVMEVSAIFVASTTFLAPFGVGSNIFTYYSLGKVEYMGHIINSGILLPNYFVRLYSISYAVSISS